MFGSILLHPMLNFHVIDSCRDAIFADIPNLMPFIDLVSDALIAFQG